MRRDSARTLFVSVLSVVQYRNQNPVSCLLSTAYCLLSSGPPPGKTSRTAGWSRGLREKLPIFPTTTILYKNLLLLLECGYMGISN